MKILSDTSAIGAEDVLPSEHVPSTLKKALIFCFIGIVILSLLVLSKPNWYTIFGVDVIILLVYFQWRPKHIFHPNNMVFAFHFLYVVVPTTVFFVFKVFSLRYLLPWAPPNWLAFHQLVYIQILFVYFVVFFSFYFFTRGVQVEKLKSIEVSKTLFWILLFILLGMLLVFIKHSGGLSLWLDSYENTYLTGPKGLGVLSFALSFLVPMLCFLLGCVFYSAKRVRKIFILIFSLLIILVFSYFQGLKSSLPVFLLIFLCPYLYHLDLNKKQIFLLAAILFFFIYVGNYFRSDAYYHSLGMLTEYLMSYFNAYQLQNMVITHYPRELFATIYYPAVKYLQFFFGVGYHLNFDISVMLTKVFFPKQWYVGDGTQQWPIMTDLYFNYYGMLLGWLPLMAYTYIISKLYQGFCSLRSSWMLIYLFEFIAIFTTLRDSIIQWDILVMLFFYAIIFFYLRGAVNIVRQDR